MDSKAAGLEAGEVVPILMNEGCTITETMKIITRIYSLPLAEVKTIVSGHQCWIDVVVASDCLHAELLEELEEDGN